MFTSQLGNSNKLHCFPFFVLFSFWYNYWTNNNIGKNSNIVNIVLVQKHISQDTVRKTPMQAALKLLLLFHWLLNLLQPADKLLSLPVSDASVQHPHDWLLWRGEETDESSSYNWHKYLQIEWLFMVYWRSNWKPKATPSGLLRSQYYVRVKQEAWRYTYRWAYCETGGEWQAGRSCRLLRRSVSLASKSRWEEPQLHQQSRWWTASHSPSQWRSNRQTYVCTVQDWHGWKTQEPNKSGIEYLFIQTFI